MSKELNTLEDKEKLIDDVLNTTASKSQTAEKVAAAVKTAEEFAIEKKENKTDNQQPAKKTVDKAEKQESDEDYFKEKKSFKDIIPIKLKEPEYDDYYEGDDDYDDEEISPKKKNINKSKRKKSLRLSAALIMLFIIIGISVLLSITIIYLGQEMMGIDKNNTTYIVEIPDGATTNDIADILKENSIIKVPQMFTLMAKLKKADASFVSGEHQLRPNMAYEAMIEELITNPDKYREYVTVTFPEGMTLIDAANLLEENAVCEARSFIYYFNTGYDLSEYEFYQYLPQTSSLKFYSMEGYLFPDTYEFYVGEKPEIVCRKIFDNFESKFTSDYYARLKTLDMTMDEVITLASVVQAEAGNVADMKKVASVFHNRLAHPDTYPMLQSDPTRKYVEDVIEKNSSVDDAAMNTAYNTYESAGLPPGAIGNPGIEAIEAVLYPETTDYYYFCANVDTGEVFYAATLEEHNANLALAGIELE